MAQIFSASTDRHLRRLLLLLAVLAIAAAAIGFYRIRSDSYWGVGDTVAQPIGFRHDVHAGMLGIGCAFCHQGAEQAAAAGMPSARTCLICHSRIWRGTAALQPLFTSARLGQPIVWKSLYRLPDYVRFDHGAHSASGIPCATCHGDVRRMSETVKAEPMSMAWCLDCHRAVGKERRRRWLATAAPPRFAERWTLANPRLTDCSTCHY